MENTFAYDFSSFLLAWKELAYYEENTRDFLFPEPKLTSSHLGMHREVLMKTAIGFPVSDPPHLGFYRERNSQALNILVLTGLVLGR